MRLRVPDEGETVVDDAIRGDTTFAHEHLDDPVIARADGSRALQLRRRGRRPRRRHHPRRPRRGPPLEHAQAAARPRGARRASRRVYAHLPLLHGPDGKKLSKRHGAASVQELRDAGYLPEAVRNYLALLGWGHEDDTQFSDRGAVRALPHRARLAQPGALRRAEAALDQRALPARAAARRADARGWRQFTGREGSRRGRGDRAGEDPDAGGLLAAGRLPVRRPGRRSRRRASGSWAPTAARRRSRAGARGAGRAPSRSTWRRVEAALARPGRARGAKPKDVFQPVRVAIAGSTVSPGIFESVARARPRRDAAPHRRGAGTLRAALQDR